MQLPASKVDKPAVRAASDTMFKLSGSFKKPGTPQDDRFEPLLQLVRVSSALVKYAYPLDGTGASSMECN